MVDGFANCGRVWSIDEFRKYVDGLGTCDWASSVTFHHTGSPSLAMRPRGFTINHLENLKHYYSEQMGWSAAPHFFVDDLQIWGMTPPERPGVHAVSFNRNSIGIEVLGNYDTEDPLSGQGEKAWRIATSAVSSLMKRLDITEFKFHRDDPLTKKSCPGNKVSKEMVNKLLALPPTSSPFAPTFTVIVLGQQLGHYRVRAGKTLVPVRKFLELAGVNVNLRYDAATSSTFVNEELLEDTTLENGEAIAPLRTLVPYVNGAKVYVNEAKKTIEVTR